MAALISDIRHGWRVLRGNPGFTAVAVLTLALGLGANTTIFCLLYSVVLRPLPYPQAGRLMSVYLTVSGNRGVEKIPWSYPKFEDFRRLNRSFESLAAYTPANFNLTGDGDPERASGELVSPTYFPMLGIHAAAGRLFLPSEDDAASAPNVVVISDGLWRRRYGADRGMLGRTIRLNQLPVTVVGILGPGVKGESSTADIWAPIVAAPLLMQNPSRLTGRMSHWHQVLGRLRPGTTLEQARADVEQTVKRMEEAQSSARPGMGLSQWGAGAERLADAKVDSGIRYSLIVLFAAIGFVLLIACVNLANLLLSRAVARQKDVAVRLSLGATRAALIRQFLIESVLLALLGGLAGLLVAAWGLELLRFLQPEAAGRFWSGYVRAVDADSLKIQGPVVAFNLLLSLITGLLFGLWPAFRSTRCETSQALKGTGEAAASPRGVWRRFNTRGVLVSAQMALALVLLAGAGLTIRSFARLLATDLGVHTDRILTFRIDLPRREYNGPATRTFYRDLTARLAALPGVEAAAVTDALPVRGQANVTPMKVDGQADMKTAAVHQVGFDFFRSMGVPLIRGRLLSEQDNERSRHVALINQSAARRLFGGQDPLGRRVELWIGGFTKGDERPEIVGIVGDVKFDKVEEPVGTDIYLSYLQSVDATSYVVMRSVADPEGLTAAARAEVNKLDAALPIYDVKTMERHVADATSRARFSTVLLGVFAALALALAAIGVYGVISYSVAARTREIGIRIALGATRANVLRMVLGDGFVLCLAALAAGVPAAFASTRVLASLLYQVKPGDLTTFLAVSTVLAGVALLATFVPARRACAIDPANALRTE
jgi:predicted permease